MEKSTTKHYSNGEVTIVWKPQLCIHSGICTKGLPNVFKPKERPWIQVDAATTQQLVEQVARCPSGALNSFMNDEELDKSLNNENNMTEDNNAVKAVVMENGPLLVHCDLEITNADGTTTTKEKMTAFCRCGASNNKPFCDGSHKKAGFEG